MIIKKWITLLLYVVFGLGSLIMLANTFEHTAAYKSKKKNYCDTLSIDNRLMDIKDYLVPGEEKEANSKAKAVFHRAERALKRAYKWSYALLALSILFVIGLISLKNKKWLAIGLVFTSLIWLIGGITLPMLEMEAFLKDFKIDLKQVPIIGGLLSNGMIDLSPALKGKIYAYYQCKSVIDLIKLLFSNGNALVAFCILCFSVVFPILKLIFSFLFLASNKMSQQTKLQKWVSYIGKYSMADVFVVALFLGFLSIQNMNPGITTEASLLPGFYFFLGYCLVSIGVFFLLPKKIDDRSLRS